MIRSCFLRLWSFFDTTFLRNSLHENKLNFYCLQINNTGNLLLTGWLLFQEQWAPVSIQEQYVCSGFWTSSFLSSCMTQTLILSFCFRKAIKFYMYDICVNPLRLDSWAGLALARMYQLEQKLNSVSGSMWKKILFLLFVSLRESICTCMLLWELRLSLGILPFSDRLKVGCVTPEAFSCRPSLFWEICGYRGCIRQTVDGVRITVLPTPHPLLQATPLPRGR